MLGGECSHMASLSGLSRRMLTIALAFGLSCLAIPLDPPRFARAASGVPTLAKITRITAQKTTVMQVRVPRAATLSREGFGTAVIGLREQEDQFHAVNPDVSIKGRGRIVGVALVERGTKAFTKRAIFMAVNLDFCAKPGCRSEDGPYLHVASFEGKDGRHLVPAGDYLLYTITDGGPVEVTLRLHGLASKTYLRPRIAARSIEVSTPESSLSEPVANSAQSYGQTYVQQGDEDLFLTAFRLRGDLWVKGSYGLCLYDDEPLEPRPLAYSYPCPTGFGVYIGDGFVRPLPYQNLFHAVVHTSSENEGGTWGFGGGYVATPAHVESFDFVQLHIGLPLTDFETRSPELGRACASLDGTGPSCVRTPEIEEPEVLLGEGFSGRVHPAAEVR